MKPNTPYLYKANDRHDYMSLIAYVSTIAATVTLHSDLLTIVVPGDVAEEVREFIDDNDLDFYISRIEVNDDNLSDVIADKTTDAETLRKIIYRVMGEKKAMAEAHKNVIDDITKQRDSFKESRDRYQRWFFDANGRVERIKSQVEAIAVLVKSIFPEK